MHAAARFGHSQMLEILFEAGAPLNDLTQVHKCFMSSFDCLQFLGLRAFQWGWTPLDYAVKNKRKNAVMYLLARGAVMRNCSEAELRAVTGRNFPMTGSASTVRHDSQNFHLCFKWGVSSDISGVTKMATSGVNLVQVKCSVCDA